MRIAVNIIFVWRICRQRILDKSIILRRAFWGRIYGGSFHFVKSGREGGKMRDVIKFLQANSTGFLATIDEGKPRVRPFQFMFEEDGKLFFLLQQHERCI